SSSDPEEVVRAVRPKDLYVADLNQITGIGENLEAIAAISCLARTMADIGVSSLSDMDYLPERVTPVLGTETSSLELIEEAALQREIVVSVDMKNRMVLSRDPELAALSPLDVLRRISGFPVEGVILLELDRVGTSLGLDKKFLEKASSVSDHPLILGGGVKGPEDLEALERLTFGGALVATAVHNGRIPMEMLR
ncbi:MAG: HisA/HisF-related TIM barrel protein, partial [Methanotrichaceae archaeon]|nr:HisA/HisF-related TIM barrel protein [Methanotrichaceae archaeon]